MAKWVQAHLSIGMMGVLIAVLLGVGVPAHASSLSGLVALKAMAQEAVPYEQAIANPKPTFMEFYADWCGTCQAMAPIVQRLHEQYGDRVNFVLLDVDDPQWLPQIEQYQVSGIPHMILLDRNQTEVQTWVGQVPAPILSDLFAQL